MLPAHFLPPVAALRPVRARTATPRRLVRRILGRLHMVMLMMVISVIPTSLILVMIPMILVLVMVMVILLIMIIASDCRSLLMVVILVVLILFLRGSGSCATSCGGLFPGSFREAGRFLLFGLRGRFFAAGAVVEMVDDFGSPLVFGRRIALVVDNLLKLV